MGVISKTNKFLAFWIALPTFFSYSAYFFPKALKSFVIAPIGLFLISVLLYVILVFLQKPKIKSIPEAKYLVLLLVILSIGLVHTNALSYGYSKLTILYTWIILFFLYGFIIVNNFETFVQGSIFCGLLFMFFLFKEYGDPISFFRSMQGETLRLGINEEYGKYALNPIWIARYLGYIFLLTLFIVKKKYSALLYAFLLLLFLYMVTSGSKGPIVALVCACLVFFADSKAAVNVKTIFILILIAAGLILLLSAVDFFSSSFYINRFTQQSSSAEGREFLMDKAFHFYDIPSFLFGAGTGNFGYLVNHHDERAYPHNIVAELFYENGIVSLIILGLIYFSVIKKYKQIFKYQQLRLLFAVFVYFALNSMFSGDLYSNEYFFIFFILFHCEDLMIKKTEILDQQLYQTEPLKTS
jgi:O-antigen ligase